MRFDRSYSEKCGAVRYGVTFRAKLLPQTLCYYLTLCDNWIHISIVINGTEFAFPLLSMWKSLLWMHTFCFRLCRFRSGTGLRQRVSSKRVWGVGTMATPCCKEKGDHLSKYRPVVGRSSNHHSWRLHAVPPLHLGVYNLMLLKNLPIDVTALKTRMQKYITLPVAELCFI